MSPHLKSIGILGGGISGLSTAFYFRKRFSDSIKILILEKSNRTGGWIRTVSRTDGNEVINYEQGPRTIRPAGDSGMNTLDLVEELGLGEQVLYVTQDHPGFKNRFIYLTDKLVKLPVDKGVLFKTVEPFERPLVWAGVRDIVRWRKRLEDDSVYNFVQRRFGTDIAEYVIDPVVRGICAGDARSISVKFLMKNLFAYEQKYGSALLGLLINRFKRKKDTSSDLPPEVGLSNIAICSLREHWGSWTLEGGLQHLPYALEQNLKDSKNVEIKTNCEIRQIKLGQRQKDSRSLAEIEYLTEDKKSESLVCDHIVSTIPSVELSKILRKSKPSHPSLWKVFETMECTDVQVTNLMFKNKNVLKEEAFGFLVPSSNKVVPGLLGVVFDTCPFPQGEGRDILTVMSKPELPMDKILSYLFTTLGISVPPDDVHNTVLSQCIPQYNIGHYEKVDAVRRYVKAAKLPLTLAGSPVDGVSVNDAIYSGRKAVDAISESEVYVDDDDK